MTALLVIIIVLIIAQIVRYEMRVNKATKHTRKLNANIAEYQKKICDIFDAIKTITEGVYNEIGRVEDSIETISRNQELTCDKLHRMELKLDSLEAKTPYKKRVRKMKVGGVEVPVEAQETKSANANGTETIIDKVENNKEVPDIAGA